MAEWLRRLTRNQIPSGSAGSSPADCGKEFFSVQKDIKTVSKSGVTLEDIYFKLGLEGQRFD